MKRAILFLMVALLFVGSVSALDLIPRGTMINRTLTWQMSTALTGTIKNCNDTVVWQSGQDCSYIYAAYVITPYGESITLDQAVQKEYWLVTERAQSLGGPGSFTTTIKFTPPQDGMRYTVVQFLVNETYRFDPTVVSGKTIGYVKKGTSILDASINASAVLGMCPQGYMVATLTGSGTACYKASKVCPNIDGSNKCNYPDVDFYCIDWDWDIRQDTPCDANNPANICGDGMSAQQDANITTIYPKDGICDRSYSIFCDDKIAPVPLATPGSCPIGSTLVQSKYCFGIGDGICDTDNVLVQSSIMCVDEIGYKGICDNIEANLTIYKCDSQLFAPVAYTSGATCTTYPNKCIANETCLGSSPPGFCTNPGTYPNKGYSLPSGTCQPAGYQCTIDGADSYSSDCPPPPVGCGNAVRTCINSKCSYTGYCGGSSYCNSTADCTGSPCVGVVSACQMSTHMCYMEGTCVTMPTPQVQTLWDIIKNLGLFTSQVWPKVKLLLTGQLV